MQRRYLTLAQAAPLLAMTIGALRKRCTRGRHKLGRDIVANLGDGVIGVKFGRHWRVRFPGDPTGAP